MSPKLYEAHPTAAFMSKGFSAVVCLLFVCRFHASAEAGGSMRHSHMGQRTGDASLHETFECDLDDRLLLLGTASSAALLPEMDVRLSCCLGPPPPAAPAVATFSRPRSRALVMCTCVSMRAAVMIPHPAAPPEQRR